MISQSLRTVKDAFVLSVLIVLTWISVFFMVLNASALLSQRFSGNHASTSILQTHLSKSVNAGSGLTNTIGEVYGTMGNVIPIYEKEEVGYIFLGDSRTVGMNKYIHMDEMENTFVVAKVGKGYDWMVDSAIKQIDDIINSHDEIGYWFVLTNLGVNDPGNIDKYVEYYNLFENVEHNNYHEVELILISVNPMLKADCAKSGYNYDKYAPMIRKFNQELMNTRFQYIDCYSQLVDNGFTTVDGLHYTEETYFTIYSIIADYMNLEEVLYGED